MSVPHIELPATPRSVGQARHFVLDTLAGWGADGLDFAAGQTVTELATNAVLHARTAFAVRLVRVGPRLRIEVADQSPALPHHSGYGVDATTGRGLALVAELSRSWGFEQTGEGKVVWCEVEAEGSGAGRPAGSGARPAGAGTGPGDPGGASAGRGTVLLRSPTPPSVRAA